MSESVRNVTRIDIEPSDDGPKRSATHGWQVRIRRSGKRHTKFFSDGRYEGREAALQAAIAYRDELLDELPEVTPPSQRRAWSNTGVAGLSLRDKLGADGMHNPYVQLSWIDAARRRRGAAYSVNKWGLRQALWNACARLYREHTKAGRDTLEAHTMFARAQDHLHDELARDQLRRMKRDPEPAVRPTNPVPGDGAQGTPSLNLLSPDERLKREEALQAQLERALFG
jgi:hypothetical protein